MRRWMIISVVGGLGLIAGVVWLARTIWPDDAGHIRRHLSRLAQAVTFDQNPGLLGSVARGRQAAREFTAAARVKLDFGGLGQVEGQDAIAALAAQACQLAASVRVTFPDARVAVAGDSASVEATGMADGLACSGEAFREIREFRMRCVREQGDWRIASVEEVRPAEQ